MSKRWDDEGNVYRQTENGTWYRVEENAVNSKSRGGEEDDG